MMMKSLHLLVFFLLFVIIYQLASIDGHDQQLTGAFLMNNPSMNIASTPMPNPKVDHRPVDVFNKVPKGVGESLTYKAPNYTDQDQEQEQDQDGDGEVYNVDYHGVSTHPSTPSPKHPGAN